jgi:hypothetical protein
MREVAYAGGTFVTGDDIAEALLEYAAELANAARAATVHVPARGTLGQDVDVAIVIGPSSQLMSAPSDLASDEPDGTQFLDDVHDRLEELHKRHPLGAAAPTTADWDI